MVPFSRGGPDSRVCVCYEVAPRPSGAPPRSTTTPPSRRRVESRRVRTHTRRRATDHRPTDTRDAAAQTVGRSALLLHDVTHPILGVQVGAGGDRPRRAVGIAAAGGAGERLVLAPPHRVRQAATPTDIIGRGVDDDDKYDIMGSRHTWRHHHDDRHYVERAATPAVARAAEWGVAGGTRGTSPGGRARGAAAGARRVATHGAS